jgi:glycosidase
LTALPVFNPTSLRAIFYEQLHRRFVRQHFDNWVVWAGNECVQIGAVEYTSTLARAYIEPGRSSAPARVRCELFVADIDVQQVRLRDIDARLWTDALGSGSGRYMPMNLRIAEDGTPVLNGNNLVFESDPFVLEKTGAFSYSIEFSADSHVEAGRKEWISINDMADNRDGVIVVSPDWVRRGPVVTEVCARKVGARIEEGVFHSGRIADVTRELEKMAADVVYLLPFYRPGFADLHTGEDVRKGSLGSLYAVKDFFQIDPELVTPPAEANIAALVRAGFLVDEDLPGLKAAELALLEPAQIVQKVERETLIQAIGRAELRALTQRAHALGKKVIFDLVLMQTSRDCPLIETHPEFYVRDEEGRPAIHQIAWLVYSDVALFDLVFNEPLQEYLLEVAPYWIEACDLDGVRIDASQTVDRPFLKRIKNRIQALKPEALVLGETLCPLHEAIDVPVDMIYALMVDFHRDVEHARPLNDFLEEVHRSFATGTVAMAYFENHDSPRATHIWHEKYRTLLQNDEAARAYWQGLPCAQSSAERPRLMALLKNLQAACIDASIGTSTGTNLTRGLEWGSEWGEEVRTDFENETLLHPEQRTLEPNASLNRAYGELFARRSSWPELYTGQIYYHRNDGDGGDVDDRILAYVRHTAQGALLVAHNLDPVHVHSVRLHFDYLKSARRLEMQFDNYQALQAQSNPLPTLTNGEWHIELLPLHTRLWRLS